MNTNEKPQTGGEFHALTQIEKGQRYTLLVLSEFGIGAIAMQITVEDVKVSRYAQHEESVQIVFKYRGKRKLMGTRFHGSKSCAVWAGWVDLDTNAFTAPVTTESGLIARESRYLSFDIRYMTDAIASAPVAPLFSKLN